MSKWTWDKPVEGTSCFPHHRRWSCREAMTYALRMRAYLSGNTLIEAYRALGRAQAFNAIMFDYGDPMASRYASRIQKIAILLDQDRKDMEAAMSFDGWKNIKFC